MDHAWLRDEPQPEPDPARRLLYNIWDSRAEGMATAMEEMMLHAGYYDDNPRAREIVWIMLAQRCARGLASLYAQANEFDLQQAKAFQVEWTPRGWMRPDLDLLGFEQQLYLRQPGYGTSYVTGKYLLDELIKERAHQLGDAFTLRRFFDEVNAAGMMPVSLIRWQLTGDASRVPAPPRLRLIAEPGNGFKGLDEHAHRDAAVAPHLGRIRQDRAGRIERLGRGRPQFAGVAQHDHATACPARTCEVDEAIEERVPVVAEPAWKPQHVGAPLEQLRLVHATPELDDVARPVERRCQQLDAAHGVVGQCDISHELGHGRGTSIRRKLR